MLEDYRFWLGLLGSITGLISLTLSVMQARRAGRNEIRLQEAEKRTRFRVAVRSRAAFFVRACEAAAAQAAVIKDRPHPEWKMYSVGLEIGNWQSNDCSIVYVHTQFDVPSIKKGGKATYANWYKWYICLNSELEPLDTFAIFGELKGLLSRPGTLQFEVDQRTPEWIRQKWKAASYVGILFCESKSF
jgi:hypothetical protein